MWENILFGVAVAVGFKWYYSNQAKKACAECPNNRSKNAE
jgi:hypothetical protein